MSKRDEAFIRFRQQRYNAKRRGISFQFKFDEWIKWWVKNLGPNWLEKRGCKNGDYVMARFKDKGPYHPRNVECVLSEVNHATGNYGVGHNMTYFRESEVRSIFLDPRSLDIIAKKYGCTIHTVWDIKTKRYWKHVTSALGEAPMRKAAKLTGETAKEIYRSDDDYRATAKKYGVSSGTVYDIWNGVRWAKFTEGIPRGLHGRKAD